MRKVKEGPVPLSAVARPDPEAICWPSDADGEGRAGPTQCGGSTGSGSYVLALGARPGGEGKTDPTQCGGLTGSGRHWQASPAHVVNGSVQYTSPWTDADAGPPAMFSSGGGYRFRLGGGDGFRL